MKPTNRISRAQHQAYLRGDPDWENAGAEADATSALGEPPTLQAPKDAYNGDEADMTAACNRFLEAQGFQRRTRRGIQHGHRRWYLHLHETEHNPLILDYLIWDSYTGRMIEVELKTKSGTFKPHQRILLLKREGVVCWSVAEFKVTIRNWLQQNRT